MLHFKARVFASAYSGYVIQVTHLPSLSMKILIFLSNVSTVAVMQLNTQRKNNKRRIFHSCVHRKTWVQHLQSSHPNAQNTFNNIWKTLQFNRIEGQRGSSQQRIDSIVNILILYIKYQVSEQCFPKSSNIKFTKALLALLTFEICPSCCSDRSRTGVAWMSPI